ncbi:hypothetical protein AbraIFM66950_004103 [Aspergillus brasiliensis]|nr:hypothetical protein AbraIFM66950_004103 [Aspergillus brasiliensis]
MTSSTYADHFSIHNLPYGIASSPSHPTPQCATRLNNTVIFLSDLQSAGLFSSIPSLPDNIFSNTTLNPFASLPRDTQTQVRHVLQSIFQTSTSTSSLPESSTADITTVTMHLPVSIPAFTDYSASLPHNQHAGQIILNHPAPPPAFFHFPIGYAGRASTISVSGTPVTRPSGHFYDRTDPSFPQTKKVIFGPSRALDYELELGIIIGNPVPRGQGLKAQDAEEHIFGLVILNDWSGPLNGKNFATTISPWIVTLDALQPFKTSGPEPRVSLPPHLQDPGHFCYDISVVTELEASTEKGASSSTVLARGNAKDLFWSIRQMCAHLASTGCDLRTGDILGTGTVSGEEEGSYGCLLEVTEGGKKKVKLMDGEERGYLVDGDVVRLTAWAGEGVGFGECVGQILPARD